jgi:DNA-binding NtrC family response regulator
VSDAAFGQRLPSPGEREDRRLQSLRGELRRRADIDRFLEATRLLAETRFMRGRLGDAARVARDARGWRGWWASSDGTPSLERLATIAGLQELEGRVAIERGRFEDARAGLETVLWFARFASSASLEARIRASLSRAWRLCGDLRRAGEALGPAWPGTASADAQVQWGREALRSAVVAGDAGAAARVAVRLRACAADGDPRLRRGVNDELAALCHCFGDTRARDDLLREEAGCAHRLPPLERTRSRILRAAFQRGRAPVGASVVTVAMRFERRQLDRALKGPFAMRDACGPVPAGQDEEIAAGRSEQHTVDGLLQLLHVCHADEDETTALGKACGVLRDRLGAVAVGVWTHASSQPLAAAGSGRIWPSTFAERARTSGEPLGPEASDVGVQAAWPIKHSSATVGALACSWLPDSLMPARQVVMWMTAAASACAPLVRAWVDRTSMPVADEALGIIGLSAAMRELRAGIERAANVPYHVLIEGESGTGKELVARAIHNASARRQKRFCAINCAALSDELLEAELFGHAKGAFTGALAERPGLFEDACGGTLLLDEIADLSPRGQAKVLRVLQDGEVRRIGENFSRRVDVRIVAATNKPLRLEAAAGRFREDLRYRLDVLRLTIPPLRDRREDIGPLALHFWRDAAARVGSSAILDGSVLTMFAHGDWPGNVRELQNAIASLAVHAPRRGRVRTSSLPRVMQVSTTAKAMLPLEEARRRFEMEFVQSTLARCGGRRAEAARVLGLSRQGLAKLIVRLNLPQGSGSGC